MDAVHRGAPRPITLATDLVVLVACGLSVGLETGTAAGWALGLLFLLYVCNAYSNRTTLETQGVLWFTSAIAPPIVIATLAAVALERAFVWTVQEILLAGLFSLGGLTVVRTITGISLAVARHRGLALLRTLIVGNSHNAQMLSRKLTEYPSAGLLPVAMLPLRNGHGPTSYLPEFPSAPQLTRAIAEASADHVILAPDGTDEAILECAKGSDGLGASFSMLPPLSELFLHPSMVTQIGGLPLIPLGRIAQGRVTLPGKRLFDLVVASVGLLLISPLLALTALAIKVFDGGPVLYRQRRVGKDGRSFFMLKFRSMVPGAERLLIDLRDQNVNNGLLFKIAHDPRITRVGRFIRRMSIDELPQLWNVVRGEMSIVGPRPLPVNPEDFSAIDNKRHSVPPGITGYWQVAGDHALSYEEMVKLDLAYIENWSLWLDLHLLLRTVPALIRRRGPS